MICPRCQTEKPISAFYRKSNRPNGLQGYCKECSKQVNQEWRTRNPDRARQLDRESYERVGLANHRKRRYGVTLAEVDAIRAAQGDRCAICREGPAEHLDHDHDTGVVRGLLCGPCNRGLGLFRDNIDILREAITYVESHRVRSMA